MSMSDREVEAAALTKAASLLQFCQENWEAPDRHRCIAEALEFNQKLWSIFQSSLVSPEHPMPLELRQNILRLSIFIDNRIFEIMADPAPQKLTAIIQISQNLAAGLREGQAQAEGYPAAAPEPAPLEVVNQTAESVVWA
jgi:flagellar protein FlaF